MERLRLAFPAGRIARKAVFERRQRVRRQEQRHRDKLEMISFLNDLDAGLLPHVGKASNGPRISKLLPTLVQCGCPFGLSRAELLATPPQADVNPCNRRFLCPTCAGKAERRKRARWLAKTAAVQDARPELRLVSITLTIKDGRDLAERALHLRQSISTLVKRCSNASWSAGARSETAKIVGGVWVVEVTQPRAWHPHCHVVALARAPVDEDALRAEWFAITGDSDNVSVDNDAALKGPDGAVLYLFKEQLFDDARQRWELHRAFYSVQMSRPFGALDGRSR